jgi:2,3-dihydroxyphenylpropionate 1,2-dioxygenase
MHYMTVCVSHSPLSNYSDFVSTDLESEVSAQLAATRRRIEEFDPQLVIQFGGDHYGGFGYALLPPFCIGTNARAVGDFNTSMGWLKVPEVEALAMLNSVRSGGIDVALSLRMKVDHAFTQILDQLFGGLATVPTIPVFVNCLAAPAPSNARVNLLGTQVGRYAATLNRRVLFLASGGLSHDPPFPDVNTAGPETRECLIRGYEYAPDFMQKRVQRSRDLSAVYNTPQSPNHSLNGDWDQSLMKNFASGNLEKVASWTDEEITSAAGHGGREIKTWLAAFAALKSCGGAYVAHTDYYRQIPKWLIAFGVMHAYADVPTGASSP